MRVSRVSNIDERRAYFYSPKEDLPQELIVHDVGITSNNDLEAFLRSYKNLLGASLEGRTPRLVPVVDVIDHIWDEPRSCKRPITGYEKHFILVSTPNT